MKKHSQEEFLDMIGKDNLENLTFLLDLSATGAKKYKMLSKKTNKIIEYDLASLSMKIKDLFKSLTGGNLSINDDNLKHLIMSIDDFKQDITDDFGFKEKFDIRYYNYYLETQLKQDVNLYNTSRNSFEGGQTKMNYNDCFDFNRYPCFKLLLDQLINTKNEKNKIYDENGNEIDLLKAFLTWLCYAVTSKDNASVYWCIISQTEGVGKGVFTSFIKELMGDLSTLIDNKSLNSDFNGMFTNKTFVIFDEAKGGKETNDIIKTLVGNKTYNRKEKFKEGVEVKNTMKFLITTNKEKPIEIDKSDRRGVFVHANFRILKQAVREDLNLSLEEFFEKLDNEKVFFAADLCNLKINTQEAAHTSYMNDVKRDLIYRSNTRSDDVAVSITKCDYDALEDILFDVKESDEFYDLLNQMRAGFLNNEAINFLTDNIDDEAFNKELKTLGKKDFWNTKLGLTTRMVYRKKDGSQTSVIIRKLSNFNKQLMIDVYEGLKVEGKKSDEQDYLDEWDNDIAPALKNK